MTMPAEKALICVRDSHSWEVGNSGGGGFATCETIEPLRRSQHSEFQVRPHARDQHGAAIAVVARVVHVLKVWTKIDSTPNVRRIVSLDDVFAAVIQRAVAQ